MNYYLALLRENSGPTKVVCRTTFMSRLVEKRAILQDPIKFGRILERYPVTDAEIAIMPVHSSYFLVYYSVGTCHASFVIELLRLFQAIRKSGRSAPRIHQGLGINIRDKEAVRQPNTHDCGLFVLMYARFALWDIPVPSKSSAVSSEALRECIRN